MAEAKTPTTKEPDAAAQEEASVQPVSGGTDEATDTDVDEGQPNLKAALHAERQTIQKLRKENKELADAAEKVRLANLSEQERAVEEAKAAGRAEAANEFHLQQLESRAELTATKLGFTAAEDALAYLDFASLKDEKDVDKAVAKLAEVKPYLLSKPGGTIAQGPQNGSNNGDGGGDFIRQMFAHAKGH